MNEENVRLHHQDPAFRGLIVKATELFDEALELGLSESGSEKPQAAHFAITAVMNAAGLTGEQTIDVLSALLGTAAAEFEEPLTVLSDIRRSALFFLNDALQRKKIGPRQ